MCNLLIRINLGSLIPNTNETPNLKQQKNCLPYFIIPQNHKRMRHFHNKSNWPLVVWSWQIGWLLILRSSTHLLSWIRYPYENNELMSYNMGREQEWQKLYWTYSNCKWVVTCHARVWSCWRLKLVASEDAFKGSPSSCLTSLWCQSENWNEDLLT